MKEESARGLDVFPEDLLPDLAAEDLAEARRIVSSRGGSIIDVLMRKKTLEEREVLPLLARRFSIAYRDALPVDHLDVAFTRSIPIQFLKRHLAVPIVTPSESIIALNDPTDFDGIDELRAVAGLGGAAVVLAPKAVILSAINRAYDLGGDSAEDFIQDMQEESPDSIISEIEEKSDLLDDTSDAPVIKLMNLILSRAVKERASDIHMEPYQGALVVRYRIDGILYNAFNLPKGIQSPMTSRVKVMARLNIAEKRLPQDGRIDIRIGDKVIDIRVSIIPTAFGERVVLRLLDKTGTILGIEDLGFDEERFAVFSNLIRSPYGIILVTGPTGSGKTTTLYAALSTINTSDINIITIEDPIEYQIEGIGQIQVNPKVGLTFADGLRSIVRQDPDVILVGEVRDRETAEIAIQSSLTGHLVFSTLHTNDAPSAVTRLIDMGIEPFLVTSSVIAIVAQRLVRALCPRCREVYTPDDVSLSKAGIEGSILQGKEVYRKRGCDACMGTGYKGRMAIFEIMLLSDAMKHLIITTSDAHQIRQEAIRQGMATLIEDGVQKVLQGNTTIEEILRVTTL
ncbi:MAG: type II secretion system ATPase GspE [Deltaproteobacteria bacterium]|nr:type II secretion system ATPase GspE [Deltaproteobacteria bacterium]